MRKLTKLESFGLIAAILVSGSYFYMKKVYDPEAQSLKKTIDKLNQTIAQYNRMEEPPNLDSLQKRIDRQAEQLAMLTEELKDAGGRSEDAAEVTEVLEKICHLAKEQNMLVVKIVRDKDEQDELFTWAAVRIQLRGRYRDFVILLDRLKELPAPVQLQKLQIERGKDGYGEVMITSTLRV